MATLLKTVKLVFLTILIGAIGYVLYTQAVPLLMPPCSQPLQYSIGAYDARFGVSESQFKLAVIQAATVWNTEAGKVLIQAAPEGKTEMPVNLVYSEVQKATELGKNIDSEQSGYDAKKVEVNALKDSFDAAKRSYATDSARYDAKVKKYQADVDYWNSQGGAPPDEYQSLNQRSKALDAERRELNAQADEVNAFAGKINTAVSELNALARKINAKVNNYNENAGTDFEQGNYAEDRSGKRINIYELKNTKDLERVLIHEFGHALGLDHVENPDSIMYSFNIGTGLELSAEDVAELKRVCRLDT
jgi:hypothetical protein